MSELIPLEWRNDRLIVLDQTELPQKESYLEIERYEDVVSAIKRLAVRGAPAIGIAAAYGVALGASHPELTNKTEFQKIKRSSKPLAGSRPTARNLFWAIERMERIVIIRQDVVKYQKGPGGRSPENPSGTN